MTDLRLSIIVVVGMLLFFALCGLSVVVLVR